MLANGPPGGSPDEIVVTAPSREAKTLRRQVSDFVGTISATAGQEQFSRRDDPYCVKILGLNEEYHGMILKKIRDTAKDTRNQKEANQGCIPNIVIIFSENADDLLKIIKRENPAVFNAQPRGKFDELFQSKIPLRWWYGVTRTGPDGEPMIDGGMRRTNSSLISSGLKISLSSTVVIVDINQSDGYPLESISSFIAMIIFAQINNDVSGIAATRSILGMFNTVGPRIRAMRKLTVWDRAYLRALYGAPADRSFWRQRARIRSSMVDHLQKDDQPGDSAEPPE